MKFLRVFRHKSILFIFSLIMSGCQFPQDIFQRVFPQQSVEGPQGIPGENGKDGNSIFHGHGIPADTIGKTGDSYIDLDTWDYYLKNTNGWDLTGNLKGVSGETGQDGISAYELYCFSHPEYTGSEDTWLDDLINGRLGSKEFHTVTFDSNGGTEVASQLVLHGEKAVRPIEPTKTACSFADWVDENNDHWVFNGYSITEDLTLSAIWSENYPYSSIKINEICSKNRKSFIDQYGEESDWIELFNSSNASVNLDGCGLSNDINDPYQLCFDEYVLEPEEYLVVAVSGRKTKTFNNEYHAPFTLSQKKEGKIVFSAPYGAVDTVTYPALKDDVSYGRLNDEYTMLYPSAGFDNERSYVEKQILDAPVFSKASGMYDEEFDLTLISEQGNHIYYTLDSGTPDLSSNEFENPIHIYDRSSETNVLSARSDICGSNTPYIPNTPVNKCMVVRAICYDDFGNYSPVVSASYWINQKNFLKNGVSVMSINTDFDNLFDSEKGIYCRGKIWDDWRNSEEYDPDLFYSSQPANYHQKGFDWEREGNLTFLNEKHNLKCEQSVGIRIKGSSTRGQAKKSFNLYSRFLYDGKTKFDYKFNNKKCEKFSLRAGGNNYSYMITDPVNSMIAKYCNLNIDTQDTSPTYLFLNGEFWGIYFITDSFDSKYFEEKYDIEDPIVWKTGEIEEGYATDVSYFDDARATIGSSLMSEEGFTNFSSKYAVDSFVDNILYHSYIDHFDYHPFITNTSCWRSRDIDESIDKCDGLIRYVLYDTDFSLGTHFSYDHYPQLFTQLQSSSSLRYILESPFLKEIIKSRAQELIESISSSDCIDLVSNYWDNLSQLIKQNNLRYFGVEEAGQTTKYNTMYEYLNQRASYFATFINEL